ncbi:alkylhydroperoxidase [Methylophaga sp. 41_12_T18]|nr:alkylhydroperoxidase [Methylophaga sp. 41_12_T18]
MNSEYKLSLASQTVEQALPKVKPLLTGAQQKFGFIPNMYSKMANSYGLLESYLHGYELFRNETDLSAVEQEVILLTISHENGCEYCVSAHSFIADAMSKVPTDVTDAIRNNDTITDRKLAVLSEFTRSLVIKRGLPTRADVEVFLAVGYQQHHILEIILAISVKTISNYANHLFHTELDDVFSPRQWQQS